MIIEKYKNDNIIKLCIEMIDRINKMLKYEDYDHINAESYLGLISNIKSIIESRITYLNFWEDDK